MPPYGPVHFAGDNPPEPTGHYTAIICWGKGGHRITNNLVAGPFALGISIRSDDNAIINNTFVLMDGPVLDFQSKNTKNRVVNNIMQTGLAT